MKKAEKVSVLCVRDDAQEIIFNEVRLRNYGINQEHLEVLPSKPKKKRGSPKGSKNKKRQDD